MRQGQGKELDRIVRSDKQFIQESVEGFRQIEAGENTVVTLEEIRESIKNDRPLF